MIRAIIFDIDGVLLNSLRANAKFYRDLFAQYGVPGPTDEQMPAFHHLPMRDMIAKFFPARSAAEHEAIAQHGDTLESGFDLLSLADEAQTIIPELARQYKLGLASGRTRSGLEEFYQFSGLQQYFSAAAVYEDTVNHKPHPEPLLFVCQQLQIDPAAAVFVGDAITDIQAAESAAMPSISYGPTPLPGATASISHFSQLPSVITSL